MICVAYFYRNQYLKK